MAVTTKVDKSKITLKYDKESPISYSINSEANNQDLFDIAKAINELQTVEAKGIYKVIEEELLQAD